MSSIVKYTNSSGRTYAYRQESKWDPEKGYSVPVRTYLGRVDEVTGEIVSTKGNRGRPKKTTVDSSSDNGREDEIRTELQSLRETVGMLNRKIETLQKQRDKTTKTLLQIQKQIGRLLEDAESWDGENGEGRLAEAPGSPDTQTENASNLSNPVPPAGEK